MGLPGATGPSGEDGAVGPGGPEGPVGPAGPGASDLVDSEILTGVINGVNLSFTTAFNYIAGSTHLYLNGQRLTPGGADYTEDGTNQLTFISAPFLGDVLLIDYRK